MDINVIVPLILVLLFTSWIDFVLFIRDFYKTWIKQKTLEKQFYKWKGTNKSKIWFICWSTALSANIIIIIVITLIYKNLDALGFSFFSSVLYSFFVGFIYIIVKNYVRYYHDKDELK